MVEKLIEEVGELIVPTCTFTSEGYRNIGLRVFRYQWVYWYDGAKFLIGERSDSVGLYLVEVSTGAYAVSPDDLKGKTTCEKLIKCFHEKLRRAKNEHGRDIHQVIAHYRSKNLDLETWQINFLIS